MALQYIDVASAAQVRPGSCVVTSGLVPSPWSEAAKGLFAIAGVPVHIIAKTRENGDAVVAWTNISNVPILLHDDEPPRTNWAAIVGLVNRLAAPGAILPAEPGGRAAMTGLIEMIAGEQGLGWTARLAMIQASIDSKGEVSFPLPVAMFLAKRYGHTSAVSMPALREHVASMLGALRDTLGERAYFGGDKPQALDVYVATFLTPLSVINDDACAQLTPRLRGAFDSARQAFEDLVPQPLWELRQRMFVDGTLDWPIRLF